MGLATSTFSERPSRARSLSWETACCASSAVDILTKPNDVGLRALRIRQAQDAVREAGKIDKRKLIDPEEK